jgi:peptide/nickel transport system substrate-binding protein
MGMFGRRVAALLLAVLAIFVVSACGDDDDEGAGGGGTGEGGKQGGSITIGLASQPDFLDPASAYTVNAWESQWLVYTPPLTYKHVEGVEGTELIPGVAEAMPTISEDGKTYEFTIRKGLKYSDGTPVKASDFEHTIKRVFIQESGGSGFFSGIVGAEAYAEAGKEDGDIKGITADDKTGKVTIKLTAPDGTFLNVLATNFAGMVPSKTPFDVLTKDPPPGAGAYTYTKSIPNREFVLEKNKFFNIPGIPKGNLDKITTKIIKSQEQITQDIISGGGIDYSQDPPPADLLPEVRSTNKDRYKEFSVADIRYFFMDVNLPPFDDEKVRQAVNYAVDKRGIARLYGGLMQPTCNFLPPNMPGYEELDPCPWGDPNGRPDVEKARQLIKEAGAEGAKVTVWGNTDNPTPKTTEYYTDVLNEIGLDAEPKIIDGGVYFSTIGNAKTKAQTGYAGWFQDFPHPANFFQIVTEIGIQPTNATNYGDVNDPEVTGAYERLKQEPELEAVADEWAEADKNLVEGAYIVPFGTAKETIHLSERMDFENCSYVHPLYKADYSSFCLK